MRPKCQSWLTYSCGFCPACLPLVVDRSSRSSGTYGGFAFRYQNIKLINQSCALLPLLLTQPLKQLRGASLKSSWPRPRQLHVLTTSSGAQSTPQ
jgi:hypothetical protein